MSIAKEDILQLYDAIEEADHGYRVRFYEGNSALIFSLDEAHQNYFTYFYICSLFELGKHEHLLAEVDNLIEYVFINNVQYRSFGTFEDLLFKKASSLHNTFQFEESQQITEQLIGIDPEIKLYQSLAQRNHRAHFNWRSSGVRLMSILLIFGSSILSSIVWLMNKQFHFNSILTTFFVIISPCVLALATIGSSNAYSCLRSVKLVNDLVKRKKQKKVRAIKF